MILVTISRSNGALQGRGLALAGTIVSGAIVLLAPILAGLALVPLARAKAKAQNIMCMNNLRQLAVGVILYSDDNNGQFPSATNWCEAAQKFVGSEKTFLCPGGDPNQRCHFAFNARLSGVQPGKVAAPAQTVLLYEADGGWNVSGGPELAPKKSRHHKSVGLVFVDGHSEQVMGDHLREMRWEP